MSDLARSVVVEVRERSGGDVIGGLAEALLSDWLCSLGTSVA